MTRIKRSNFRRARGHNRQWPDWRNRLYAEATQADERAERQRRAGRTPSLAARLTLSPDGRVHVVAGR